MKFITFIVIFAIGFILIKFNKWIVDHIGTFPTPEKMFGPGGTHTMWKLAGVLAIAFSFYYIFNY